MNALLCLPRSRPFLLAAVVSLLATPAYTQDALIVDGQYLSASRDPGEPLGSAPAGWQEPLAGGGRYAVGPAAAIDIRTQQSWPLPPGAIVLAVDPARPRAFLAWNCVRAADRCDVVAWHILTGIAVSLTTIAYTEAGGFFALNWPLARYAVDADVLFVDRASNRLFGPSELRSRSLLPVNATSGAVVRPPIRTRFATWDVWPDASRLIVGGTLFPGVEDPTVAEVIDVATERLIAQRDVRMGQTIWEPTLQAVVSVAAGGFDAFDADLRLLASVTFDAGCSLGWQVSPHTGRIYILSGGGWNYMGQYATHLTTVDGRGAIDVDLARKAALPVGGCYQMRVQTAPGPPRAFRAEVTGHDLTLAWENVGGASQFVLDVGFAPGHSALSVFLGPDSHASFANVPSGSYYLRLRGGSEFGGGRPSQEIHVMVP